MTFQELTKKFEGEIVTIEEFEEIECADCVSEVEYNRLFSEYYQVFEYSALSADSSEYFDFYCEFILWQKKS